MPIDSSDRIKIGVLKERMTGERRVALIPADIQKLISKATFAIERGAGREVGFDNNAYLDAGAQIADSREILERSDVIVKVRPPGVDEMPPMARWAAAFRGIAEFDAVTRNAQLRTRTGNTASQAFHGSNGDP